jgi:pimeloyl-ACP methyl ester carboxylesterase
MHDSVRNLAGAAALGLGLTTVPLAAVAADAPQVRYESLVIDGVEVAYREAGDPARPTVLLLHGFPTSSQMFRNLIPELAARYHVLAPDYPGFGASAMPPVESFDYSFDHFAEIVTKLIDAKGVDRYVAYVMDYGAPVGYRMFAADPERVTGFVIQNGNAYEEGLEEFWDPIRAYWTDPSAANGDKLRPFLGLEGTKWQYLNGTRDPSRISPDNFWNVQYLLDRPGNQEIQLALFYDYRTNLALYPHWQALFREFQPPALIVWGKNDAIFPATGAEPYKRDLKNVEFHLLDTGHFALEEEGPFIAERMLAFLDRVTQR